MWGVGSVRTVRRDCCKQQLRKASLIPTRTLVTAKGACTGPQAGPPHACHLNNRLQVQRRQQDQWSRRHQNSLFSRLTALPTLAA